MPQECVLGIVFFLLVSNIVLIKAPQTNTVTTTLDPLLGKLNTTDRLQSNENDTTNNGVSSEGNGKSCASLENSADLPPSNSVIPVEHSSISPKDEDIDLEESGDSIIAEIALENFWNGYCGTETCDNQQAGECYCDIACYFYRDCCYLVVERTYAVFMDTFGVNFSLSEMVMNLSTTYLETENMSTIGPLLGCVSPSYSSRGFWMVGSCPDRQSLPDKQSLSIDIVNKCQNIQYYDYTSMPVDYVVNGEFMYSFKNIFCAICNDVRMDHLEFWSLEILKNGSSYSPITPDMSLEDISSLYTIRYRSEYTKHLRRCDSLLKQLAKPDIPESVSRTGQDMQALCNTYVMPVSLVNSRMIHPTDVYMNPHCASLHFLDNTKVREMVCAFSSGTTFDNTKPESQDDGGSYFNTVNLQIFFDFDLQTGLSYKLGCNQNKECMSFEIFDCVTSTCRQLYCNRGFVPFRGECIPINDSDFIMFVSPRETTSNGEKGEFFILEISADKVFMSPFKSFDETAIKTFSEIMNVDRNSIVLHDEFVNGTYTIRIKFAVVLSFKNALGLAEDIIQDLVNERQKAEDNMDEQGDSVHNTTEANGTALGLHVSVKNFLSTENFFCNSKEIVLDIQPSLSEDNDIILFSVYNLFVPVNATRWHFLTTSKKMQLTVAVTCASVFALTNMTCSLVAYNTSEVSFQNGSILISERDMKTNNYFVINDKVFVCSDLVGPKLEYVDMFGYIEHYITFTYITSCVSILSLLFIIVYHIAYKKLRNIHGLNLCAMSFVILLIHLLLVIQTFIHTEVLCVAYAVFMHFLLLNMFSWMNVIGIDMTRIFAAGVLASKRSPWHKFIKHMGLSLCVPCVILTAALVLEFASDASGRPSYGANGVCWLTNGRAVIYFVIVPVGVSMLVNLISFVVTVRCLHLQAKETKLASKMGGKEYVIVYLKLTAILGLTWMFGLIGAFVKADWLWIVHMLLNGLQGLSLLICAVVNKRMIQRLKKSAKYLTTESGLSPDKLRDKEHYTDEAYHSNGSNGHVKHSLLEHGTGLSQGNGGKANALNNGCVSPNDADTSSVNQATEDRGFDNINNKEQYSYAMYDRISDNIIYNTHM